MPRRRVAEPLGLGGHDDQRGGVDVGSRTGEGAGQCLLGVLDLFRDCDVFGDESRGVVFVSEWKGGERYHGGGVDASLRGDEEEKGRWG